MSAGIRHSSPSSPPPLWRRLAGFTLIPVIAAVSPLLVLPFIAHNADSAGWSSALAGEVVGTFAAIFVGYGWTTIGPALIASAPSDAVRGRLYREALVVRAATSAFVLPVMALVIWLIATPGYELLAILMGAQGALIAISYQWFTIGLGRPGAIAYYDAIPRLLAAILAAVVIGAGGPLEVYPLSGIAVTVLGTSLYTARVLPRYPAPWPRWRDAPRLVRSGAPVTVTDAALGVYAAVPTPLATVMYPGAPAAGFATADKLMKLGQFIPLTLANSLQSWTSEVAGHERSKRIKRALLAHAGLGAVGAAVFIAAAPVVSEVWFDSMVTAGVVAPLGIAFALYSVRTSMSRHVLFPEGRVRLVMTATVIGTAAGVPAMVVLGIPFETAGIAIGYALTEAVTTALMIRETRRVVTAISERRPPA